MIKESTGEHCEEVLVMYLQNRGPISNKLARNHVYPARLERALGESISYALQSRVPIYELTNSRTHQFTNRVILYTRQYWGEHQGALGESTSYPL